MPKLSARDARLARQALRSRRNEEYRAARRSYRECLSGEQFKPAKGALCAEPARDLTVLYAHDREREVMRASDEIWPVGLGAGSGT